MRLLGLKQTKPDPKLDYQTRVQFASGKKYPEEGWVHSKMTDVQSDSVEGSHVLQKMQQKFHEENAVSRNCL